MQLEEELKQLQYRLAEVDLLAEPRARAPDDSVELLLLRRQELKVKMYQETRHQIPHVHVDYGRQNHVASYSINELRRLAGTLDAKYDRVVLPWIAKNQDKLLETWETLRAGKDPSVLIGELTSDM